MGGSSQPSGSTTTTQTMEPPAYLQPYLSNFANTSNQWFNDRYGYQTQPLSYDQWSAQNPAPPQQDPNIGLHPDDYGYVNNWRPQNYGDDGRTLNWGQRIGNMVAPGYSDYQQYVNNFNTNESEWVPGNAEYNPSFPTIAGFNPYQVAGQTAGANYATGAGSNLAGQAQNAASMGLNPYANPFLGSVAQNLQGQQGYLGSMWDQPGANFQSPQIGFNPQHIGVNTNPPVDTTPAINQMMSATPDMNIYSPLYGQIKTQAEDLWNQTINPAIRSEAQSAGAYGDPKYSQAMNQEADVLTKNMLQSMERLTADASNQALNQRAQGVGYGLGATGQDLSRAISQAGINQGTQQLGANLASQQAGLDFNTMGLGEQARSARAGEGLNAAGLYGSQFGNLYGNVMDTFGRSLALAPSTYSLGQMPSQDLMNIGGMQQGQTQNEMNDQYQRWQNEQLGPYGDLGRYMGLLTGAAGNYGTQTSSQPYFAPSTGQNMMMGGLLGYGGAQALGIANPWMGALMGAGAMGLF